MTLFQPQSVGLPGLVVILIGGLAFFAGVIRMRFGASGGAPVKKRASLSTVGIVTQMLAFAIAGFGRILATLPPASPRALAQALVVGALMLLSVLLFTSASRAMGANWSVVARMREGHELVTSGVFSRLRHPIYVAMAAFLVALAIAFGHAMHLIVSVPLFMLGTWIRVREEERLLRAEFGAAFDDYAARVKRFVPGIV